jgi:ubiquinone/menaquinone biosynthesis C-methylase UbiE
VKDEAMIATIEQTREAWNEIAPGYAKFVTDPGIDSADDGLRRAGLRPGMRLLDVAAGTGALSIAAARLGAYVLAADLSPEMLAQLTARAQDEGLSTIETRVMDGHALELEDDTFDMSASQFGVMLFPDLPRGLREMARVTKPGGQVLMIVYVDPSEIDFVRFFMGAMQAVMPGFTGLPSDPPPLPFQVSDPEVLRRRMTEAGLKEVRIEPGSEKLKIRSGDHLWDWVTNSNPIARMLIADLTQGQRSGVRKSLDDMVRERSGGSGLAALINPVNIGIGTK